MIEKTGIDVVSIEESLFVDAKTIESIAAHAKQTGFVLFLGAGVTAHRLPVWNELLSRLLEEALKYRLSLVEDADVVEKLIRWTEGGELLPYQKAAIVKRLFGSEYLARLRHTLYKEIKDQKRKKEDLLDKVVTLCRADTVVALVTYNFDDLLVEALRKDSSRRLRVVWGPEAKPPAGDPHDPTGLGSFLHVFHIHGYIPRREHAPREIESALVFSQDEYFQNMLTPFSWQTTTQLHFLRNYTALFLGTSLNDVNMARMLHHAKGSGPLYPTFAAFAGRDLLSATDCDSVIRRKTLDPSLLAKIRMRATVLDDLGVKLICTGIDWESVGDFVARLSNAIENSIPRN